MKINVIRTILIILLFATFYIIFGFSSQDGETSSGISRKITDTILQLSSKYNNLETEKKEQIADTTEKIIRKLAHFSIYALVGFLLMGLLSTYKIKENWKVILTILLGMIYATSDEIHQSFTPGRSPKITDVYIDTLGIIVGAIIILIIIKIYKKCYKKMTKNDKK